MISKVVKSYHLLAVLISVLALGALPSCSSALKSLNPEMMRLKNRGPVPLSSDNPYIAANALLIKEMKESQELRGFIKHRGGPAALEVRKDAFIPLTMDLYYPDKQEFYSLEQSENTWLITGPFKIERAKLQELKPVTIFVSGKPNLTFDTLNSSSNKNYESDKYRSYNQSQSIPKAKVKSENLFATSAAPQKSDLIFEQARSRQQEVLNIIKNSGSHPAELSPSGDVVHYVIDEKENLKSISEWYTFDASNINLIAKSNEIPPDTVITPGDTIIVPHYLVRNKNRLTSEALIELLK